MGGDDVVTRGIERRPVEPPNVGTAWRALYEGPEPEAEPVEDDEADVVPEGAVNSRAVA